MRRKILLVGLACLTVAGCQTQNQTNGAIGGGIIGGIIGTGVGIATHNPAAGMAIGAGTARLVGTAVWRPTRIFATKDAKAYAAAHPPLSLAEIVSMSAQRIPDDQIIRQIVNSSSFYVLTSADLTYLNNEHVSPAVIAAIQQRGGPRPVVYAPATAGRIMSYQPPAATAGSASALDLCAWAGYEQISSDARSQRSGFSPACGLRGDKLPGRGDMANRQAEWGLETRSPLRFFPPIGKLHHTVKPWHRPLPIALTGQRYRGRLKGEMPMYEKRFGLARRPFPPVPDSDRYYPATSHEAALATLQRGLADDEGIVLLTGAPGTGKTLLAQVILDRLGDGWISAFVTNSHLPERTALLQAILYDLRLPHGDRGEQVLRLRLTEQLLKNCDADKRTVLIVDEAHHLSADLLEELRLLTNLEAGSRKACQVVLIGQSSIVDTLKQPALAALQQRLAVRCRLEPLGTQESADFLQHHLRQAGAEPEQVFEESALEILIRGCAGLPRRLNQAAHHALVLADSGNLACIDAEAALEALVQLGLSVEEPEPEGPSVAGSIDAFEANHRRSA